MIKDAYFAHFAHEFSRELHRLRKEPKSFVSALEDRLNCLEGGILKIGPGIKKQTVEGANVILEAIEFCKHVSPTLKHPKVYSTTLKFRQVSMKNELQRKLLSRNWIKEDAEFESYEMSKETCFGSFDRPTDIILDLLVDDGNLNRINRNTIFRENLASV